MSKGLEKTGQESCFQEISVSIVSIQKFTQNSLSNEIKQIISHRKAVETLFKIKMISNNKYFRSCAEKFLQKRTAALSSENFQFRKSLIENSRKIH